MTDEERAEFEAARAAGLKARHETRVERAIRRQVRDEVAAEFEPILYASDDGTEFTHGHPPHEGEPECPACWVQHIRQILGIKLPPKSERPLHVMSCDDCRADLDVRDHYPDCSEAYS